MVLLHVAGPAGSWLVGAGSSVPVPAGTVTRHNGAVSSRVRAAATATVNAYAGRHAGDYAQSSASVPAQTIVYRFRSLGHDATVTLHADARTSHTWCVATASSETVWRHLEADAPGTRPGFVRIDAIPGAYGMHGTVGLDARQSNRHPQAAKPSPTSDARLAGTGFAQGHLHDHTARGPMPDKLLTQSRAKPGAPRNPSREPACAGAQPRRGAHVPATTMATHALPAAAATYAVSPVPGAVAWSGPMPTRAATRCTADFTARRAHASPLAVAGGPRAKGVRGPADVAHYAVAPAGDSQEECA
ncbi:hypothetical protein [Burkholderia ambifaria]|uniref:hypothetical protein n=1 Tax=Burkholderia ambifaria TaxID=152480 RepID=UPI00159105AC|nr:hypothetical protein [Burkholderia ambifaria]